MKFLYKTACFLLFSVSCFAQNPQGIIIADSANGRSIPDIKDSSVLFTVKFSNTVNLLSTIQSAPAEDNTESFMLDTSYPWYQVESLSQKTGWIYGKYLIPLPSDTTLSILYGGLYTHSLWKSENFKNEDIKDYYLMLSKWSYPDSYIPDKYDIVLYLFNGTSSVITSQKVDIQIDEESGKLTGNLLPPPTTRWITKIRKYSKTIDSIASGELQKIVIPNISFTEDIQKEQQLISYNWIWGIRLQVQILLPESKLFERTIQVIPQKS